MGFIKWLIEQYRVYQAEKIFTPDRLESERAFINTTEQVNAIINLCCVSDRLKKDSEV